MASCGHCQTASLKSTTPYCLRNHNRLIAIWYHACCGLASLRRWTLLRSRCLRHDLYQAGGSKEVTLVLTSSDSIVSSIVNWGQVGCLDLLFCQDPARYASQHRTHDYYVCGFVSDFCSQCERGHHLSAGYPLV